MNPIVSSILQGMIFGAQCLLYGYAFSVGGIWMAIVMLTVTLITLLSFWLRFWEDEK
jgi:hypothetical protein